MTSSYGHVLERQPALGGRLDSPGNLDTLQAKKNFSVSHLLDLEEAGDMVAAQADESSGLLAAKASVILCVVLMGYNPLSE
ncbi:hypothetical protein CB1_000094004 [Camelus ferus]|nr:hypothetical protein CB1_000094004 [Camelus ferus]